MCVGGYEVCTLERTRVPDLVVLVIPGYIPGYIPSKYSYYAHPTLAYLVHPFLVFWVSYEARRYVKR